MTAGQPDGRSVVVVGGGVVGTSTAYALADAGHDVTLISAGPIGDGASAGNAGLLVPADSVVWPGPANRRAVPATVLGRGGSSIDVAWTNPRTVPWGLRFLAASTARQYAASSRAAHELSVHSLEVSARWAVEGEESTDLEQTGMLFLVDSGDAADEVVHARTPLQEAGEKYLQISRAELIDLDPAYAAVPAHLRAVYAPHARRGNSEAYAQTLASRLRSAGSTVIEHRPVREVLVRDKRVWGVETAAGRIEADAVVLAAGVGTRRLARSAGVRTNILPVKGYAATVPVIDPTRAPETGGVLESTHVAFSRMGDYVRLSTGAEIGRTDHVVTAGAKRQLQQAAETLFPGALDWSRATFRAEHRPMTPHGLPLVGATKIGGLYLNSGHGSLGWTQAAGSADVLAHVMRGARSPVDSDSYRPRNTRPAAEPISLRPY